MNGPIGIIKCGSTWASTSENLAAKAKFALLFPSILDSGSFRFYEPVIIFAMRAAGMMNAATLSFRVA